MCRSEGRARVLTPFMGYMTLLTLLVGVTDARSIALTTKSFSLFDSLYYVSNAGTQSRPGCGDEAKLSELFVREGTVQRDQPR